MYKLVLLSTLQGALLATGNALLKLALEKIGKFAFTWRCIKQFLANLDFLASGLCMAGATVLWLYILRHYPFSAAYPLISLSYVFGVAAALLIFHEHIPPVRYLGIAFIMLGVILIAQK